MIPFASPIAQYESQKEKIQEAIQRVLESGCYILGPEVKAFESEFAAYLGVKHCIGVGNGTDALQIALAALGVSAEDEVITVAHTAAATVSAIVQAGARPVFVDIDPETYTLNPSKLKKALSGKSKAIVAVHLYGHPVDLNPVLAFAKENGLKVIEDCAQAHGATYFRKRVGSLADVSCFSFYPTKNLGAIGDGGAVCTNSSALAEKVRLMRQYGWVERYVSGVHGWNTRLDELQSAILRVKLCRLDQDNASRVKRATQYLEGLAEVPIQLPHTRPESDHVFHLFAIATPRREELRQFLKNREIQALTHYPQPLHLQPGYRAYWSGQALPITERLAREELSLPMYPGLPASSVNHVIQAIREFFSASAKRFDL